MLVDEGESTLYQKICHTLQRCELLCCWPSLVSSERRTLLNARPCLSPPPAKALPIFPVDPVVLAQSRERVLLAREIDVKSHALRKTKAEKDWRKRTAEEMEMLLSEDEEGEG